MSDTIYALSSGAPPSGVAVIRLSGGRVRFALETICGGVPEPRYASLRSIRSRNGDRIDRGLVLFFPGPHSFTGEDCAELQVHGSRAVVSILLKELSSIEGLRHGEPGEFTRRAFEHGRLDLTAVEGLADLIAAQTEAQRRLAFQIAEGGLSSLYQGWADRLLRARAMIEAEFDFSDEDDIPDEAGSLIWADMAALADDVERHLGSVHIGERIRDGFRVAIVGRPNVGKSSLLNALARRDVAIVSEEAGTTRDVIAVPLDLAGYAVTLVDTAGLRDAENRVEQEGVARAQREIDKADIVLHLVDGSAATDRDDIRLPDTVPVLKVATKADLVAELDAHALDCHLTVSSVSGAGLDALVSKLTRLLQSLLPSDVGMLASRERHRLHLTQCLNSLREAVGKASVPLELRAEDLRRAGEDLGRLTGRTDAESLLDVIFSEFCVGK